MRNEMRLAAVLMSVIALVGFLHAPVVPVLIGATLACAWFWLR